MDTLRSLDTWSRARADVLLDLVRIYLGLGLMVMGWHFISDVPGLMAMMEGSGVPAASVALAHYIALAHLAGGLMLAVGLLTRLAAAVQVPILAGAVFFVHWGGGLFTASRTLEFTALVLFLLVLLTVSGSGRLSADHYLFRRDPSEETPLPGGAVRPLHS